MESAAAFGICTVRCSEDAAGELTETFWFKLVDDQTFEVLHEYEMKENENSLSCIATQLKDDEREFFIVGTGISLPEEPEPKDGRILVFVVTEGKLELVAESAVKGAVYDLEGFNGHLLAAVNSRIWLFKWVAIEDSLWELKPECSHHGHILALFVKSRGDFIVVGDIMKSVSLLIYKPEEQTIEEIAKDCNSNWITSIGVLDDDTFLAAENSCNIFMLKKNADASNDEDRSRLE